MAAGHLKDELAIQSGRHFWLGDIACAEGAITAGCRFFAGYPITPASEIAERMAVRLPDIGGVFIQMEDEIASMAAILGASWVGAKVMTATSGPGMSLMLENIGLGVMTETPCVIVNVQRGGPSTGLPTFFAQADMMQAKWGSHGDYEIIALCPESPQECFDLTMRAFELAETYRVPVILLTDGLVGHMTERVDVPEAKDVKKVCRPLPTDPPGEYVPFKPNENLVPPMAAFGEGYKIHATGLTHDERGYPALSVQGQDKLIKRLINKIKNNADDIIMLEEQHMEDAEIIVVSFGVTSRIAAPAVEIARERGFKAGSLRMITAWPFPEKRIRELSEQAKAFIVPEINMGQMVREVERIGVKNAKVVSMTHAGGDIFDPEDICKLIEELS